ncbi:MAG: hypothetical protein ACYTG1_09120 [Planctomycetota bacterium]|jgi:prepilin-type processing-associated H-X9-DG protein
MRPIRVLLVVSLFALFVALAPDRAHAEGEAVIIRSAGLEKLLVDPKDAGLRRALDMLHDRVGDLPAELGTQEFPAPALQLLMEILHGPMSLRVNVLEGIDPREAPPFSLQLDRFTGTDADAAALAARLAEVMAAATGMASQPAPDRDGMRMLDLDGVPGYHGAMRVGDSPALTVAINRVSDDPATIAWTGLPASVQPALAVHVDFPAMAPVFDMMREQAGPEAEMMLAQLEMAGLTGPNAATISAAMGYGLDRAHGALRYTNYQALLERYHAVPARPLAAGDLRLVPADALYAQVSAFNPDSIVHTIRMLVGMVPESKRPEGDPIDLIAEMTGIHLERDVAAHLGDVMGLYTSRTTGNGGLTSLVLFAELTDADAIQATLARMSERANAMGDQFANGYVQLRDRMIDGHRVTSLLFPGLPIPLEPSFAVSGRYLFKALTPQALVAAIEHADAGGRGLAENPRFLAMGGQGADGAVQVTFTDAPALVADGYGLVSMGYAALANAVRSPGDPTREPGVIMPPLGDLLDGAKASVTIARVEGGDLVMTTQADRSWTVGGCAAVGAIGGSAATIAAAGIAAGLVMPAMASARTSARSVESMSRMRALGIAFHMYAAEHDDRIPAGADALLEAEFIGVDALQSSFGPAADGGADYWLDDSGGKMSDIRYPDKRVLAYDRAMYLDGRQVAALFADGHVETLDWWAFRELLEHEANEGIDFDLP